MVVPVDLPVTREPLKESCEIWAPLDPEEL